MTHHPQDFAASPPTTPETGEVITKFFDLGREIGVMLRADRGHRSGLHREAWSLLAENGFWEVGSPLSVSDNMSWDRLSDAVEDLAKGCGDLGFVLSAVAHTGIIRMIEVYGNPTQKARFLPRLRSGAVAAMAITEPGGGSDVPRIALTATLDAEGLRLQGRKAHITNAPDVEIVLAVGRHSARPEKRDICLFLVDASQPAVTLGTNEQMIGHQGSSTGDLIFNDVRLQEDDILDAGQDGLRATYEMIALDRAFYGLAASACLVPLMNQAMDHIHNRRSFGKALHEHQLVQARIVETNTAFLTGRALARQAVTEFLKGNPDSAMLCSTAKLVCTEGYLIGARNIMMIMGHRGYENGPFASAFCDAAGSCIAAGTSDIQTVNIFNQLARRFQAKLV